MTDFAAATTPQELTLQEPNLLGAELQAYGIAFELLALVFYQAPNESFLRSLIEDQLLIGWPLQPLSPAAQGAVAQLQAGLWEGNPADLSQRLHEEYIRLFIGPQRVLVPSWESVYLSRDHLLFDVQTVAVRQDYARFGLQIPRLDREPDDHIGFELLFISHLMKRGAEALERGNMADAQRSVAAAHGFLHEHLQQWSDLFADRLAEHAATAYYRGWGSLLRDSLAVLTERLDILLPTIQSPS